MRPRTLELMRRELAAGGRPLRSAGSAACAPRCRASSGLRPGAEQSALYEECIAGLAGDEPEIVGRQLELATITASLLNEASTDHARHRGTAGIGKSALCRELERLTAAEGWLRRCRARDRGGRRLRPSDRRDRAAGAAPTPTLLGRSSAARRVGAGRTHTAGRQPAPPMESPISRHRAIGALRRLLLEGGATDAPVVLVVDDAHLADEATIDALGHLGASSGPGWSPSSPTDPSPRGQALARDGQPPRPRRRARRRSTSSRSSRTRRAP